MRHDSPQGTGLIFAEAGDDAAVWLLERLRRRGLRTELVTTHSLCVGARWIHVIDPDGARFELHLADGRRLQSADVRFVVNRMARVPHACLAVAEGDDGAYAEQEWRALLCSILQALAPHVPVVERPDPYALAGRWRSPAEWLLCAARAGLAVAPWRWHDLLPEEVPCGAPVAWVLVIGDAVLSECPLPSGTAEACRRLREIAGASVLQLALERAAGKAPTFRGVAPMADLRLAGDGAVDALARVIA